MLRIGINGIGRIGKLVFRLIDQNPDMEVVAVNDPMDLETMVHLLKFDSVHGSHLRKVCPGSEPDMVRVNGHSFRKYAYKEPAEIPWSLHQTDLVIESSGVFLTPGALRAHLQPGVGWVVLTCPPNEPLDNMIVMGVNEKSLRREDRLISNASCTTNCAAPLLKVFEERWGIDKVLMNTVHPYTNSQSLIDAPQADLRRARSAAWNIIPTTTSAIRAIKQIMPSLDGRFDGFATRVPVANGSFVELNMLLKKETNSDEINEHILSVSASSMQGIIEYCHDPIVSSDVTGNPHSCIFDALSTRVVGGDFVQVIAWYDNEFGYSNRVVDLIRMIAG